MSLINDNAIFLLDEIVKKNFAVKYRGSILGILWSVLKPLLIMILLTIIFSTLFIRIDNYPVYLLSGKCIFDFFVFATNVSLNSLKGNINILKRTAAPKFVFPLGAIISEFINFIITLIILVGVMIVTKAPFHLVTSIVAIIPIFSLILMIIGIGLILAVLCVYFSDIQHLWSVVTYMLMYASAIFYPMDIIPEPFHQYMILNPLFWVIDQFRHLVIWGTIPSIMNMINLVLLSLIIFVLGLIVFKKYEKKLPLKF